MSNTRELPKGWSWSSLEAVCRKITDGTHHSPSQEIQTATGEYLYVTAKNIKERGVDLSNVAYVPESVHRPIYERCNPEEGDVLYIKDGVTTGVATVNQLREEFSLLSSVALLKPRIEIIDPHFLKWFLNSPTGFDAMTAMMGGTAIKRLTLAKIKEGRVIVAPLLEQRRIVSKIEELFSDLDAGVSALARAKANLKRYRASVLKAAVEGRLTADWRAANPNVEPASEHLHRILTTRRQTWETNQLAEYERRGKKPPAGWQLKYVKPIEPDTKLLSEIPPSWTWATVEECSSFESNAITDGPFGSNLKTEHYTDSGPHVIRLNNIGEGDFKEGESHISSKHFETLTKHSVNADDIIIAMLGETLPRACLVPEHIPPAIVKADCARFSTCRDLLLPKYATYALNSISTRQRVSTLITGVGRPRINLGKTRTIPLPLPPLDEQKEIALQVERLYSAIDHNEEIIRINLQRTSRLRQSILKQAFEGKLVLQAANESTNDIHMFLEKNK